MTSTMPDPVAQGTFRLTEGDLVAGYQLHRRAGPRWRLVWIGGSALVLYQFYLGVRASIANAGWMWPTFVIGFLIAFVPFERWILYPLKVRRIYKEQKSLQGDFRVEITGEGLNVAGEIGSARVPWNHFLKWKESASFILLYHSRALFQIMPKRAFEDKAVARVRALLAERLGPAA